MLTLVFAFHPLAYAQETVGDKVGEAKDETVHAKREAGAEVRHAGREVKAEGRKVRQAVITRCADGRHTVKGASGCAGHGGVNDPK
jgi:trimethylamine:corrinoid methyltransferase-like protein